MRSDLSQGCSISLWLLLLLFPFVAVPDTHAQATAANSAQKPTAAPNIRLAPFSGDFDGMLKRGFLRALVAPSKTQYYVVNGVQHGSTYEYLKAFEEWVNRKYPTRAKNIRFHVVFLPVSRDQLLANLTAGRGDLAVAL
jgi:hypothetical protein